MNELKPLGDNVNDHVWKCFAKGAVTLPTTVHCPAGAIFIIILIAGSTVTCNQHKHCVNDHKWTRTRMYISRGP